MKNDERAWLATPRTERFWRKGIGSDRATTKYEHWLMSIACRRATAAMCFFAGRKYTALDMIWTCKINEHDCDSAYFLQMGC